MGFYIDMINVGQGDSFLLTLDSETVGIAYVLIDSGTAKTSESLIKHLKVIAPGRLNIIVTHLDNDHIGGLKAVVENLNIIKVFMNVPGNLNAWLSARQRLIERGMTVNSVRELAENLATTEDLLKTLAEKGLNPLPILAGKVLKWGNDIRINVFNPTEDRLKAAWADELLKETIQATVLEESSAPGTTASNNSSVILELEYKEMPYALFTGDADAAVIKEVIGSKSYTFLKVPHHGSKSGLDEDLLKIIKPKTAFLSVGDNPHGHPATEILDIIKNAGAKVYCTNRTKYCRKECKHDGYGNICHKQDKEFRPGWSSVDSNKCSNNR